MGVANPTANENIALGWSKHQGNRSIEAIKLSGKHLFQAHLYLTSRLQFNTRLLIHGRKETGTLYNGVIYGYNDTIQYTRPFTMLALISNIIKFQTGERNMHHVPEHSEHVIQHAETKTSLRKRISLDILAETRNEQHEVLSRHDIIGLLKKPM